LRKYTPKLIRMMVQTLIIAAYVIVVDISLSAYLPEIHKALGPYVGLIITNCIIMGRCEVFASNNTVKASFYDGLGSGLGYSFVLLAVAVVREFLGFGSLLGVRLVGKEWVPWTIMVMPAGAFFMLGLLVWLARYIQPSKEATS